MKRLLLVATVFCAAFASCQSSTNISSYSTKDSLSYAAGVQISSGVRMQDSTLNANIIGAAFRDVFAGNAKMTQEEAYAFLNEWFMTRLPAENLAKSKAWLEDVKAKNPNVKITDSGLMYEIINEGDTSIRATSDLDQVVVGYKGTFENGTEFDASDSISFPLNGVIPGWTEGMKLVGKGGEVILWVPSELAYAADGRGQIQANTALRFDVKLIDVIPEVPAEVAE